MFELRILNGLHRGATLPLDEEALVIGSDDSADVVLLDPGVVGEHARLRRSGAGWTLTPVEGEILGPETNRALDSLELNHGEFARIGRIWVTIADGDDAWTDPPEEPVDIAAEELQPEEEATPEESRDPPAPDEAAAPGDEAPAPEPPLPAAVGEAQDRRTGDETDKDASGEAAGAAAAPEVGGRRRWSRPQLVLGSLGVLTVAGAIAAYALTGPSPASAPFKPGVTSAADTPPKASQAPGPTQEELRTAFRKRLAEVDLLKRFDLNLRDNVWNMQAALDDEEAARFERILAAFVAQHKIAFPINAKVGSAEHMLPFRIRQVISGANASIVTLDGVRLYVGDEYQGVRLVAIKGSRLTFAGKRKIEVRW